MRIPDGYGQMNILFGGQMAPYGAQVTFGVDVSAYTGDVLQAATDAFGEVNASNFDSMMDNDSRIEGVLMKFGPNDDGPSAEYLQTVVGTGGASGGNPAAAILFHKITARGGRRGRGRGYWPCIIKAAYTDDGQVPSGTQTSWNGILTSFLNGMAAADLPLVLLHSDVVPESDAPEPILQLRVDNRIATQRRRLRR